MNSLDAVAAIITLAAFVFAVWSHTQAARKERDEQVKVGHQRERLRSAIAAAASGAEAANLIVQRAGEEGVSVAELQNMARIERSILVLLVRHLEEEQKFLSEWEYGRMQGSNWPARAPRVTREAPTS